MGKYQVHGPGLSNYNEVPNIYADISIGTVNRKDYGDSIDVDVSGSLLALVNPSYFGYTLKIYVSFKIFSHASHLNILLPLDIM